MKYINNEEKLKNINLDKNNISIIMDFDGTITRYTHVDSWDVAGEGLGENFKKELTELFEKYRPIEIDYEISYLEKFKAMEEWYKLCIDLYYKYGLTKTKLKEAISNCDLQFREGAKEFFESMRKNNIPVIILSAGIGNVIEGFLNENNCYFDNMKIISNFINFDNNGNINKFDGKIITSMNKTLKGHKIDSIKSRKYKVLFGDLIEDKNMVEKEEWNDTISFGFLDKKVENLPYYKKAFDIVLTKEDGNFYKVINILGRKK